MAPKPFLADVDLTLFQGDVLAVLAELPDESVDCVVTSPPYWGLRDYGTGTWEGGDPEHEHDTVAARGGRGGSGSPGKQTEGAFPSERAASECSCGARRVDNQLGLEASPKEYVEEMVEVFREVRRVLRKHGTCWLNIGDSYFGDSPPRKASSEAFSETWDPAVTASRGGLRRSAASVDGLKPKDLCMVPAELALGLRADGWHLRSEIIWSKPNPMPESVTDRPTRAEERIYLLTKSPTYYYDQEAVREAFETRPQRRLTSTADQPGGAGRAAVGGQKCQGGTDLAPPPPQAETLGDLPPEAPRGADGRRKTTRVEYHEDRKAHENYANAYGGERWPGGGRNMRNVWTIATQPYPGAHFAVFPEELVRRCILAGTSEKGYCPECGAPWEREVEIGDHSQHPTRGGDKPAQQYGRDESKYAYSPTLGRIRTRETIEWRPTCGCGGHGETNASSGSNATPPSAPAPAVVLDPFAGSGTTAYVARKLGRHALLIELSVDYCELIAARTQQLSLLGEDAA